MDIDIDVEGLIPPLESLPVFTAGGSFSSKGEWLASVDRSRLPLAYRGNTTKELLCLEYVENFRQQFEQAFPDRPPLFLSALNEAGVPKFVCTTVRPSLLPLRALYDMHSCAQFVARYFQYEPLSNPMSPPDYLLSPASTVERGAGDAFDLAVVLVSLLAGAGYDAMCVVGVAPAFIALKDTSTLPSLFQEPSMPEPATGYKRDVALGLSSKAESAPVAVNAYNPKEPPSLESAFDVEMRARQAEATQGAVDSGDLDGYMSDEDESTGTAWMSRDRRRATSGIVPASPEEDPIHGHRVHCWVVVLPGPRGIKELVHIEPSTGMMYTQQDAPYLMVDVAFNHKNLWVNMQETDFVPKLGSRRPDVVSGAHLDGRGSLMSTEEARVGGLVGRAPDLRGDMGVPPLQYDETGRVIVRGHIDEHKEEEEKEDEGDALDPVEAAKRRVLDILARAPTKPRAMSSAAAAASLLARLREEEESKNRTTTDSATILEAMATEAAADAAAAGNIAATAEGGGGSPEASETPDGAAEAPGIAPVWAVRFDLASLNDWENVFIDPDAHKGKDDAAVEAGEGEGEFGTFGTETVTPADTVATSKDAAAAAAAAAATAAATPGGEAASAAQAEAPVEEELELESEGDHVLDLPPTWVKPLRIPRDVVVNGLGLRESDHGGLMEVRERTVEWKWGPRAHPRGVIHRVKHYCDDARVCESDIIEEFDCREDCLKLRRRVPAEGITEERFLPGRPDGLRKLVEVFGESREMEFYPSARTDALLRRFELFGRKITEFYDAEATPDRLEYRSVTFLGPEAVVRAAKSMPQDGSQTLTSAEPLPSELMVTSVSLTMAATGSSSYVIRKMAEKFARDPAKAAHRDVAKFKFLMASREIEARFHTAAGRVVPNTRLYRSRREASEGMDSSSLAGHLEVTMLTEDSFAPVASEYEKELDFRAAVLEQKRCFEALRSSHKACTEQILRTREDEEATPRLTEDPFSEALRRVRDGEPLDDGEAEDDVAAERQVDYLAPFLVDVPDPFSMDQATAKKVRMKCQNALKQRHRERLKRINQHLEAEQEALERRLREFARNRGEGSEAAEAEYQKATSTLMFRIGILRDRLKRQETVMQAKVQELMATFRSDPRLSVLYEDGSATNE
jgi:hypothetical protein